MIQRYIKMIMKPLRKYLSNKFVLLGLFIVVLLFGVFQLNIGSFSSSDFDLNQVAVGNDDYIKLQKIQYTYTNPIWGDISSSVEEPIRDSISYGSKLGYFSGDEYGDEPQQEPGLILARDQYCYYRSGNAYYTNFTYGPGFSFNTGEELLAISSGEWLSFSGSKSSPSLHYVTSITCGDSNDYHSSGTFELTNSITLNQDYNNFEIQTTEVLNGQDVTYYLIHNSEEYEFNQDKTLSLDLSEGDEIKIKGHLEGTSSSTPAISNNITLLGSYVEGGSSAGSSSSNSNTKQILGMFEAQNAKDYAAGLNPLKWGGNVLFSLGELFEGVGSFFSKLF